MKIRWTNTYTVLGKKYRTLSLTAEELLELRVYYILKLWYQPTTSILDNKDFETVEKVLGGYRVVMFEYTNDSKSVYNTFFISEELVGKMRFELDLTPKVDAVQIELYKCKKAIDSWDLIVKAWAERKPQPFKSTFILTYRRYFNVADALIRILK